MKRLKELVRDCVSKGIKGPFGHTEYFTEENTITYDRSMAYWALDIFKPKGCRMYLFNSGTFLKEVVCINTVNENDCIQMVKQFLTRRAINKSLGISDVKANS